MSEDDERDPLARLRAADPAAEVEPTEGFAAAVIAQSIVADGAGAPPADLDAARGRGRAGRPVWLPLVAVAATVAIIGGAGLAIGARTAGGGLADGAGAPITIEVGGSAGSGAAVPGAGGPAAGSLAAPGASDRIARWGAGRTTFTASGLSTSAGTARAYGFDARAGSVPQKVAALATALGIRTAPKLADGAWQAGSQDGTGASLTVGLDGTLGFSYYDPARAPQPCAKTDDGTAAPDCDATGGSLPSADAAIAALRDLVGGAGRDAGAFAYSSDTPDGATTRVAQAWPVLDGQRVDQAWTLELGGDGVVSASGTLAPIVALGEYPVVSAQQAFERLTDPRFGAQQTGLPIALREQQAQDASPDGGAAEPTWPTEPPAAPKPGTALSWPVDDVHIVGARLGLASQWQPDGSVLVVPAYELTDADGGTWSVIAVADGKLDFSAK